MDDLSNELEKAFKEGNLLQSIFEKSCVDRNDIEETLISLHNNGLIDIISSFSLLENKKEIGYNYFQTRTVFEKILPRLNAPVKNVMTCVLHLVRGAGQDLFANTTIGPYVDFCSKDPSRPLEALKHIESAIDNFANLITPTIVAGSKINVEFYLNEAIRLTKHEKIEVRREAIFSLGRIKYTQENDLINQPIKCLELSITKENDDNLLGNIIRSAFSLYKINKTNEIKIVKLIDTALSLGANYTLHAGSELFSFNLDELPESLLDSLLKNLCDVNPNSINTIGFIDHGLSKLLNRANPIKGIEFLETILNKYSNSISMEIFESVITSLSNNENVLSKLLTRWFLNGERILCEGIHSVFVKSHKQNMLLEIDQSELPSDPQILIFLAKKIIGYLIFTPLTALNLIISLMNYTDNDEILDNLGSLIYNPLFLNSPGKLHDYLKQKKEIESGKKEVIIEKILKSYEDYMFEIKSTGLIHELHPSQTHKEAYNRHFSMLVSESFKKAQKNSIINLFPKVVLLYGRKSINYVSNTDGKSNRIETPLKKLSSTMDMPRLEIIEPFDLDHKIRFFRVEKRNI